MNFPAELKYSRDHEWVKMLDDTTALVGISDFAQSELGDLVYVNLPVAGDDVVAASFDVDDRLDFERFLSSLSEKQRSIILARIRGENNKEIASRLGCTPQAVGDIVRRVRGHYQAYMKTA